MIRLGALGDVIRTFPAVSRLRRLHPGAHIAWLVEPGAAQAVATQDSVDEVLVFPRPRLEALLRRPAPIALLRDLSSFAAGLRRRRFDLVVDFHSILKSGALARLSGASLRVGYASPTGRELSWLFHNLHVDFDRSPRSRFERNAALVEGLDRSLRGVTGGPGSDAPACGAPLIQPGADAARAMAEALGPEPFVLIHPGTSPGTEYKRYAPASHAKVAKLLAEQPGIGSLVAAGPSADEQRLADAVVSLSDGAASRAPETSSFEAFAALVGRSSLFVGSDSGPLHLASLVGTPVVQILGPTHPLENRPYAGTPWRQVRVPLACSPCRRGCLEATCMLVIPPAEVARAAGELLALCAPPLAAPRARAVRRSFAEAQPLAVAAAGAPPR